MAKTLTPTKPGRIRLTKGSEIAALGLDLVDVATAATMIGKSVDTVRRWADNPAIALTAYEVGINRTHLRFDAAQLRALDSNLV
jgi:hypothetical protein